MSAICKTCNNTGLDPANSFLSCPDCPLDGVMQDIPPAMAEQFRRAVAGPQPANPQSCEVAQVGNSAVLSDAKITDDLIQRIVETIPTDYFMSNPRRSASENRKVVASMVVLGVRAPLSHAARLTNQNPLTDHQPVDETGNLHGNQVDESGKLHGKEPEK